MEDYHVLHPYLKHQFLKSYMEFEHKQFLENREDESQKYEEYISENPIEDIIIVKLFLT